MDCESPRCEFVHCEDLQRNFLLDDRSCSAIEISGLYVYNCLLHVDLHRAYDHVCGPLSGHSSATGSASRCGVHDKSSQTQATWGINLPSSHDA
jgi:hypothetical protein